MVNGGIQAAVSIEKAICILEIHKPWPLSEYVRTNIRFIIEEAEKELGVFKKEKQDS